MTDAVETMGRPPGAGDEAERVDLESLLGIVKRRLGLMICVFVIVFASVAAWTFLQKPMYQAETVVEVETPDSHSLDMTASSDQAAAASAVKAKLGLSTGPSSIETVRLLMLNVDVVEKAIKQSGATEPLYQVRKRVTAETLPESELIALRVEDSSPQLAADIADKVVHIYCERSQQYAKDDALRAMTSLEAPLRRMRDDLAHAEDEVRDYKVANGISDATIDSTRVINAASALDTQLFTARSQMQAGWQSADYYRSRLAQETRNVIASSTIARSPVVKEAETELTTLEIERAGLVANHGPEYAHLQELDRRIAQARSVLSGAVSTVVDSQVQALNPLAQQLASSLATAEASARAARASQSALSRISDRIAAELKRLPAKEAGLARLERTATIHAQVYAAALKQYHQAAVQAAVSQPMVVVISQARTPSAPVRPIPRIYLPLGLLLALILAVMCGAMAELMFAPRRSEAV